VRFRRYWPLLLILAIAGWVFVSWSQGGVMAAVVRAALDGDEAIDTLRKLILSAGVFAPLVYVAAVTIEVLVAPLPGALLYAPGGAIFGGFIGGTLSLAGNTVGAAMAAWIAGRFGPRVLGAGDWPRVERIAARVRERGVMVVLLLRINPLTSSDLVSYAAGFAGVSVWRVTLGTAIGMAPLCYAQSYASEWLFRVLPGSGLILIALAVAYMALVFYLLFRGTLSRT
jgi:uncharacterized membrane protein YdjX (TVP38/TMEM64 family)